jgi:hypothetical protein
VAYIGNDLQVAFSTYKNIDDISGSFDGVTTSFALLVNGVAPAPLPLNSNQCLISVGGVVQRPDDTGTEGFRLSGGNIVFSSAPNTAEDFFGVILAGADYVNAGANFPDGTLAAPSITFDQDNDTGYYRSGSGAVSFASNGVAAGTWSSAGVTAPALIPTGSSVPANGVYLPAANTVGVATNGVERVEFGTGEVVFNDGGANYDFRIEGDTNTSLFFVDASAEAVGIGTSSPPRSLTNAGSVTLTTGTAPQYRLNGTAADGDDNDRALFGLATASAQFMSSAAIGDAVLRTTNGGNLLFGEGVTERLRIDSSGRLLVRTSSTSGFIPPGEAFTTAATVQVSGSSSSGASSLQATDTVNGDYGLGGSVFLNKRPSNNTGIGNGHTFGSVYFAGWDTAALRVGASIKAASDGSTWTSGSCPSKLVFSTTASGASSPTERMRISQNGETTFYGNGSVTAARSNTGAGTGVELFNGYHSATGVTNGTRVIAIYTNGNIQNTNGSYTTLSDAKLKENIVDAGSQWDDLKAIQIRNWNFKAETGHETHRQIGPIAQELEAVCPGLVFETPDRDEDGNETGEVTKGVNQSVLYMKAVKALQEAMERIEILEASNTDLLARVSALESA